MIECQICNKQFLSISGKHLKNHGLTAQEYKDKFPGHTTRIQKPVSADTRAKMSNSKKGRKHTEETKAKIGSKHRGKKISDDSLNKWRISYQNFLQKNGGSPQKGYKRSQDFKNKMSKLAKARSPELVQQKVDSMLAARRGQKMTVEQKEKYIDARLKYIAENPTKLPSRMFNTKPELEFQQELQVRQITFQKNKKIGKKLFDFVIGNCVVELDGPHHRNPLLHGNKNMTLEERYSLLKRTQENDEIKTQLAKDQGYQVFRIQVGSNLPKDWYQILINQGFNLF